MPRSNARLIAHLFGDYVVQSDWMAWVKTRRSREGIIAASVHALTYTACFLPLTRSPVRLAVIGVTHGLLDHYRLLPALIAAKDNVLAPPNWRGNNADDVEFWLHILVDNSVHLLINEIALTWRPRDPS